MKKVISIAIMLASLSSYASDTGINLIARVESCALLGLGEIRAKDFSYSLEFSKIRGGRDIRFSQQVKVNEHGEVFIDSAQVGTVNLYDIRLNAEDACKYTYSSISKTQMEISYENEIVVSSERLSSSCTEMNHIEYLNILRLNGKKHFEKETVNDEDYCSKIKPGIFNGKI